MPRYYFNLINDRGGVIDDEGQDFSDVDAVQEEAIQALGEMVRDAFRTGTFVSTMSIAIRDDLGLVMQVRFSFEVERT